MDVLLVEDSETDAKLIVHELRRIGLAPRWLRVDSAQALESALTRQRWHLVISDSSLPGLSIIEAIGFAHRHQPGVPFIAVSGTLTPELALEAVRSGAADYLAKDNLDRIGEVVVRELERARTAEGTAPGDISRRLLAAQEEERRRIARVLHDEFGQLLVSLRTTLGEADEARGAARGRKLSASLALADQAIQQVRDFYHALWPVVLDDLGLPAALQWLAERHARSSSAIVELDLEPIEKLPQIVEIACFRIAQEALANCARHARASRIELVLRGVPGAVEVSVRDNGAGFDTERAWSQARAGSSLGLLAMQERASLAGGRLDLTSAPGGGTRVLATLPRNGS